MEKKTGLGLIKEEKGKKIKIKEKLEFRVLLPLHRFIVTEIICTPLLYILNIYMHYK